MKKILSILLMAAAMTACTNDDQYSWDEDFADLTATDTIRIGITWSGSAVAVTGDSYGYVSTDGGKVTVTSATNKFLQLTLSGTSTNGSLIIYSWKKLGIVLNNLQLTNPNGPAINNQCSKTFVVTLPANTVSTLTDGTTYTEQTFDQKGTLFSEGQIYFQGTGSLTVNGHAKNGIASDDYIVFDGGTVSINVADTGTNGIKVNDGFTMNGGTLAIGVSAPGARGIKCDARTTFNGGTLAITTTGDCKIETTDGVSDTTSCAGIKSDSLLTINAGTITINSSGDGGKGINCDENVDMYGGTLTVTTTGSNNIGKPKGVKSSTGIIVRGGSFTVKVSKSWACDDGTDSEDPTQRVTIVGSPTTSTLSKRSVIIKY